MSKLVTIYCNYDFVFSCHADSLRFFDNGQTIAFLLNSDVVACLSSRFGDSIGVTSGDYYSTKVYKASDFSISDRLSSNIIPL